MMFPKEAIYKESVNGKEIYIRTVIVSESLNHYQEENGSEFRKNQLFKILGAQTLQIKDLRNWFGNIIK